MLPDFGWSELLVIAIVLIVIVGPKDLPKMLRTFGKTTSSLRKMAGDFRRQFDDALKEAELDDVRQIASDLKGLDPRRQIKDTLSPLGKIGQDISGEIKKAASSVQAPDKSETDKAKTDTSKPSVSADSAKAIEAASEWADDLKPAAKAKATAKPKAAAKPATKAASTRKSATAKAPAKSASTKTAAAKTSTAKPKTASPKPKTAASKTSSAGASKSRTPSGQTKSAAKPKAATKTTKTAAKDQS